MRQNNRMHSTTILGLRRNGKVALGGDGQVTYGDTIFKSGALSNPSHNSSLLLSSLIPFFILQCPQFEAGLIFIMALGIITGALSGGPGTIWLLTRVKMETS